MLRVRQLLTEVLLDVTNREIADVAHIVYMSAKARLSRGSSVAGHCHVAVLMTESLLFLSQ